MTIGAIVYVALVPSLLEAGRPALVAASLACGMLTLWPWAVQSTPAGRAFYATHRDFMLLVQ